MQAEFWGRKSLKTLDLNDKWRKDYSNEVFITDMD
jgi:hypothetical protein